MYSTTIRGSSRAAVRKQTATLLSRPVTTRGFCHGSTALTGLRNDYSIPIQYGTSSKRQLSFTSKPQAQENFPPPEKTKIKQTDPVWPHPVFTEKQMKDIVVAHRDAKNWSDWVALGTVRFLRWGTDLVTGYRHDEQLSQGDKQLHQAKPPKFAMNERKWLIRFIFLESVAGVPGMVGGMLRHLRSLRRMKRDNGWIESLLEEAYNERMHLLSFLRMAEPGIFMRIMVLGAQGVFFNGFFLAYLLSPRTCHRFVGYLEEEAVTTYSRALHDLEAGALPEWQGLQAPDIAIKYWKMPEGHQTVKDMIYYIRADEAKHREVNHTLGNLQQKDPNPFVSEYVDPNQPHPTSSQGIENIKSTGWERKDII